MDQPSRDGVAALRRSGRVCAQPEGQRSSRRSDGENRFVLIWSVGELLEGSLFERMFCASFQVLEPRFNVETMALLLNIPPNKTLLRRHLATHFNLLVGSEAQQLKQECLENPDYTLLTATAKVKVYKTSSSLKHLVYIDMYYYIACFDIFLIDLAT